MRQRGYIYRAAAGEVHGSFEFKDCLSKHFHFFVGLPERQVRRNEVGIDFNHIPVLFYRAIEPARKIIP